jgi:NADH-quinone oxidoreductase subunit C
MPMTLPEIHARLRKRFGEAIGDWQEPQAGDASIRVTAGQLHAVCAFLRDDPAFRFDLLRIVSAVEQPECFSSVYHLYSYEHGHSAVLRADLDKADPRVDSVMDLWIAAEWHEREAFDMMGIVYEGHADLRRILLPDDWDGYPLRKDYEAPKSYNGVTNE